MNSEMDIQGDRANATTDFVFVGRTEDGETVIRMLGRHQDQLVREGG